MPKIVWCGNKPWDTEFPEKPIPKAAHLLKRPETIFKSSLVFGILPLLLCCAMLFIKWFLIGERIVNPFYIPLGILLGLLLMPVHELLHAVCYTRINTVYVGISIKKFAAFAVCHEPISKIRFVIMSLMPVLLGIVPFAVFLAVPPDALISGICVPCGIIGFLSPMPDYMDVYLVLKQLPKGATLQSSNSGIYWYK